MRVYYDRNADVGLMKSKTVAVVRDRLHIHKRTLMGFNMRVSASSVYEKGGAA